MVAAGEVDVDRPVELDARLAPARDLLGVALGVGGGELAAGVAGAGDEAGADRARLGREAELLDRGFRERRACSSGTPEISRFCQTVRRISPSPRSAGRSRRARASAPASACRPAAPRRSSCRPVLLLRDARRYGPPVEHRPRRNASAGTRTSLRPSLSSTSARYLSKPKASSTYFSRALLRLVRSPWSMKTRTMASATSVASSGFTITPVSRAKSLWPVMPPSAGGTRRRARRRSRPSPRRPGSRCRWCPRAPRSCRRRRRRR